MIASLKVEAVFSSPFPSANFMSEQFRGTHLPDDPVKRRKKGLLSKQIAHKGKLTKIRVSAN